MEIVPGRPPAAIGNARKILLVQVAGARKVCVGVQDDVPVSIGLPLQKPAEDAWRGRIGVLDSPV